MKETHVSKELTVSPTTEVNLDALQEMCKRVFVRDGLRCRICNVSGKLIIHSRTSSCISSNPDDVIAVCSACASLARIRKQKHTQSKGVLAVHLVCFLTLFLATAVILMALALVLPPALFILWMISMYAVLLLDFLAGRWF